MNEIISESNLDYIKRVYEFVRDEIPHSWDIKAAVVSQKASEGYIIHALNTVYFVTNEDNAVINS